MERNSNPTEQAAAKKLRKQKIMIGVLAAGFGIALLTQPKPKADLAETNLPVATLVPATRTSITASESKVPQHLLRSEPLPTLSIAEITTLELFHPTIAATPRERVPAPAPVHAVYGSTRKRAALIGTKTIVRAGQSLPNLGRIVGLSGDGIQVKP